MYVTNDHACWGDADLAKKVLKKRFGGVQRSPQVGLNHMMEAHAKEVYQFIGDRVDQGKSGNTTEEEK